MRWGWRAADCFRQGGTGSTPIIVSTGSSATGSAHGTAGGAACTAAHVGGGQDVGWADQRAAAAEGRRLVHPELHERCVGEQSQLCVRIAVDYAGLHVWAALLPVGCHWLRPRHGPPAAGRRRVEQRRRAGGCAGQGTAGQAGRWSGPFQQAACKEYIGQGEAR